MPRYLHYAHLSLKSPDLTIGKKYEAGTVNGRVGKTGTTVAHCHFEVKKDLYLGPNFYPYKLGIKGVTDHYEDPLVYLALPGVMKPMVFDHLGYGYLSKIAGMYNSYHPGVDLNNGAGDSDLEQPLWLCQRATLIYSAVASGWGLHRIFEVDPDIVANPLIRRVNEALRTAGSIVDQKRSEYWQERVMMGEKKDFLDLTNGIRWRMQNRRYPHENGD